MTIIIYVSAAIAAFITIINFIRKNPKVRTLIVSILLILSSVIIYIKNKKLTDSILTIPIKVIDVSGNYSGFFTDNLGHKTPAFLIIKLSNNSDSLILTFKNKYSQRYFATYNQEMNLLNIDDLGTAKVTEEKGIVKIESENNQKNQWIFQKDLISLY